MWVYQSCMSQGCAYGTNAEGEGDGGGWPSYMVDRSAARNRAMQWVAFLQRASGELYYETGMALPTAWTDQFRFNGNGDGTLFYPGTPAAIGGTKPTAMPSIRLKHIRQGMQDYEWLKLVSDAGDPAFAQGSCESAHPGRFTRGRMTAPHSIARRLQLISRYLELTGKSVPDPSAPGAPKSNGQEGVDPVTGVGNPASKKAGLREVAALRPAAAAAWVFWGWPELAGALFLKARKRRRLVVGKSLHPESRQAAAQGRQGS